jgi:hypothetical protein
MSGVGPAPVGPMAMKDVCDLQLRAAHRRPARLRIAVSPRSMVRAGRVGWLRPGSWYWRRGRKAPSCRAWRDPAVMRHNTHPPISLKLKGLLRGIWCYRPW